MKTIVLVGRPNVGKSSLFNVLTKTRDALVADIPGLTRDRHYSRIFINNSFYTLVDTGGLEPSKNEEINILKQNIEEHTRNMAEKLKSEKQIIQINYENQLEVHEKRRVEMQNQLAQKSETIK